MSCCFWCLNFSLRFLYSFFVLQGFILALLPPGPVVALQALAVLRDLWAEPSQHETEIRGPTELEMHLK